MKTEDTNKSITEISNTNLTIEMTNLKKQIEQKDKENKKLKSNIDELKEMIKLQKEQLTQQFEKEKNELINKQELVELITDRIFYQNKTYKISFVGSGKEIKDEMNRKNIDEGYLTFVVSQYDL